MALGILSLGFPLCTTWTKIVEDWINFQQGRLYLSVTIWYTLVFKTKLLTISTDNQFDCPIICTVSKILFMIRCIRKPNCQDIVYNNFELSSKMLHKILVPKSHNNKVNRTQCNILWYIVTCLLILQKDLNNFLEKSLDLFINVRCCMILLTLWNSHIFTTCGKYHYDSK